MEPFTGQLMLFGGNFVPVGYLPCDGSLQQISDYEVLYTLIGTTYGGDGVQTFAMPDLRGRAPQHMGTAPGLPTAIIGQMKGTETNTVTNLQMPAHSHTLNATVSPACNSTDLESSPSPAQAFLRKTEGNTYATATNGQTGQTTFTSIQLGAAGGNSPINNLQPLLAMTYCICSAGIYPSPS